MIILQKIWTNVPSPGNRNREDPDYLSKHGLDALFLEEMFSWLVVFSFLSKINESLKQ
jgi:hypothetical protein